MNKKKKNLKNIILIAIICLCLLVNILFYSFKVQAMPVAVVLGGYVTGELLASIAVTGMAACGIYSKTVGQPSAEGTYTAEQEEVILKDYMTLPAMLISEGIVTESDPIYEMCKSLALGVTPEDTNANNAINKLIEKANESGIDLSNQFVTKSNFFAGTKEFFKYIIDSFANVLKKIDVKTLEKYDIKILNKPEMWLKLNGQSIPSNIQSSINGYVAEGYNYVLYGTPGISSVFDMTNPNSGYTLVLSKSNFVYSIESNGYPLLTDKSGYSIYSIDYTISGAKKNTNSLKYYTPNFLFYYNNLSFTAGALSVIGQAVMPDKYELPLSGVKTPALNPELGANQNLVRPFEDAIPDTVLVGNPARAAGVYNNAISVPVPGVVDPEEVFEKIQERFEKAYTLINDKVQEGMNAAERDVYENFNSNPSFDISTFKVTGLAGKFPFCIPFDLIAAIKVLVAKPEAPVWTFPLHLPGTGLSKSITINMTKFESVAYVCRWVETLGFTYLLITKTRGLIKG
jgi:hypothetical protein